MFPQFAGNHVSSIFDILQMGIYVTNAVKTPKVGYSIDRSCIENSLPYLEAELSLFPNIKVVMLMGDVAKKAFNMLTRKSVKKNIILLIEKSKVTMIIEDIAAMLKIIDNI